MMQKFDNINKDDPRLRKFCTFFGERPKDLFEGYPAYALDRDFGQLANILNNIQSAISQGMSHAVVKISSSVVPSLTAEQYIAGLNTALEAAVVFFNDATGVNHVTGQQEVFDASKLVSFYDAIEKFEKTVGPAANGFYVLIGLMALDMMFFAGRQDSLMGKGRAGPYTFLDTMKHVARHGIAIRAKSPDLVGSVVSDAVVFALSSGITASVLEQMVSRCIAKVVISE
jgi:acid phosphatase family membrane protein YuiD